MYTRHFGLSKLPFENVPDPAFFFDEGDYARIHNRIKDSLNAGRGLMVVSGPVGSGKTTLSQMIISEFSDSIKLIWMAEPPGSSADLFLFIAQELGLKPAASDKTFVLRDIRDALSKINAKGNKCLVIMDESHLISDDTINGVRLLNNLEEGSTKLIQILLLGQDELMKTIKRPDMEHFKQRIAALEMLGKMSSDRLRSYISHRIHVAGGNPSIIADTGWEALILALNSGGVPRIINSICDRSLHAAFERGKQLIDVDDVYEAAQEMGLGKEVFFYKLELKKAETEKEPPEAKDEGASEKPEASVKKAGIPAQPAREKPGTGFSMPEENPRGLKGPLLLLLLSIISLILSIAFYFQRSGSL